MIPFAALQADEAIRLIPLLVLALAAALFLGISEVQGGSMPQRFWAAASIVAMGFYGALTFVTDLDASVVFATWALTRTLTPGLVWAGLRVVNGGRGYARTLVLSTVGIGAAALLFSAIPGWGVRAALVIGSLASVCYWGLCIREALRGAVGRTGYGVVLAGVCAVWGVLQLLWLGVEAVSGALADAGASVGMVRAVVETALLVPFCMLLVAIPEAASRPLLATRRGVDAAGLMLLYRFRVVARERLRRASQRNEDIVLLSCEVAGLDRLARALRISDRESGFAQLARSVMDSVPTMAEVSFAEPNVFVVLWAQRQAGEANALASRLQTEITKRSMASVFVLSATVVPSVYHAADYDYDIDALLHAALGENAERAVASSVRAAPNRNTPRSRLG